MRVAYIILIPALALVVGTTAARAAPMQSRQAKPSSSAIDKPPAKKLAEPTTAVPVKSLAREVDSNKAMAPAPMVRTIRTWGHGCFSKAGGFDCYGQVDNWVTESAARLRAQSLADKAVREVMRVQPGTVVSSKINVRKSERGGWEAEVTVEIAVANQLALR